MIIFLYGEDIFRSSQKLKEIKEKFLKSEAGASGFFLLDYSDNSLRKNPQEALETGSLFSVKRLVVIKYFLQNAPNNAKENLLEYFKKNRNLESDKNLVVVFWEETVPQKSDKFFRFLEDHSKNQNFKKLSGKKLSGWIISKIKEINSKSNISAQALEKLILYAGDDIFVLDKEIQKLVNFADGKTITEANVEMLVNANLASNIFDTIDALGDKNKHKALKLVHRHLKKGEDPFYLFSMFVYQFRNLLKIAGVKKEIGNQEQQIARNLKIHPFVVRKSLNQLTHFSSDQLRKIYQKLSSLDFKIKTGKIDICLALDKFIVEL